MSKQIFTALIVSVVLGLVNVEAQQVSPDPPMTKYEQFLKQNYAVVVTQSYPLGDLPGGGGVKISAKVAWAIGGKNKVYALDVSGRTLDFDELKGIEEGLDQLTQAISTSFDKLNAESMRYSIPAGLSVSYYVYATDSPAPKRNLYVSFGVLLAQSPNIDPLIAIRNQIAQGRAKLISLGAK